MKILIFGASGFLGTKLKKLFLEKGYEVLGIDLKGNPDVTLDATKFSLVLNILKEQKPEIVIDTIGLTSSLECERNPKRARNLNYLTAKNISDACKIVGSKMFFFSSSYVFNGKKGNYSEKDSPLPLGVYGKTKLLAERDLLKNKRNVIIRVDIMYGFNGDKEPNGIIQKILDGGVIEIVNPQQKRRPLFIEDLLKIILILWKKNMGGIFHVAGPDEISMGNFLKRMKKFSKKDSRIKKINKIKAEKIPKNPTLDISKINSLGLKTTPLKNALEIIKKQVIFE